MVALVTVRCHLGISGRSVSKNSSISSGRYSLPFPVEEYFYGFALPWLCCHRSCGSLLATTHQALCSFILLHRSVWSRSPLARSLRFFGDRLGCRPSPASL